MSHDKKTSFGKSLFFGKILEDAIFPYPSLRESERENLPILLESLRKFLDEKVDARKMDETETTPEEVRRGLAELGILGIVVPEAYGGYGMSLTAYCRVLEEICTTCGATAVFVGGHASIGTKAFVLYGSEEQKQAVLPKIASGEWTACYALTEPEAGSDAGSMRSTLVPSGDGKHFILNGSKQWITNGAFADVFTVFAKVEGQTPSGPTCFYLTRGMEGLVVGPNEHKMGLNGSATNPLTFENVKVPKENVIGEIGQGFKYALNILNYGRTSLGAGCIGASRRMIHEAALHALQRKQFGRAIAEFELIQEKFWRMAMNTYMLESAVYLTAGLADRGEDFQVESAVCKAFGTEALWANINDAVQIAGGNGFMREYPYERFLRDARINMIFEGTNEIQRIFIALSGMRALGGYLKGVGGALKNPLAGAGVLAAYAGGKLRRTFAGVPFGKPHPSLHEEASIVAEYADILARKSEAILRHYGEAVKERQFLQERLADMVIDLYVLSAGLSRVTRAIEEKGEDAAQHEALIVKTFAREAWHRLRRNAAALDENDDDRRGEIARAVLAAADYPWRLVQ